MRGRQVIERYRDFAARTHLLMGVFALGLIAAIIVLMIVSAVPSQAGFLAAEAKKLVTMVTPTGDILLIATVALVFLAVLVVMILDSRNPAE